MIEYTPCDKCDNGYHYGTNKEGYKYATKCKCRLIWEKIAQTRIDGERAHLRPGLYDPADGRIYHPSRDYRGHKSAGAMLKMVKYAEQFEEKFARQSLYIYGPHSTQKTTVAQWVALYIMQESRRKGGPKKAQYILMKDLIDLLTREGWDDKDGTAPKVADYNLNTIRSSDILIIDEAFDKNKITIYKSSYQIPYLDRFLRHRMDVIEKPIIFISNVAPELMVNDFPSLKDLSYLIDRRITKQGGALLFKDNYTDEENNFEIKDIFA